MLVALLERGMRGKKPQREEGDGLVAFELSGEIHRRDHGTGHSVGLRARAVV